MQKLMYVILTIILVVGVGYYFFSRSQDSQNVSSRALDEVVARQYVKAWAKKVSAQNDEKNLMADGKGGFYGKVGSLGFEYNSKSKMLIVRFYVFPYSDSFNTKSDLLPWLNDIAIKEPESVSGGYFESTKPAWELDQEASLFLRMDIKDGSAQDSTFVSRIEKLRTAGMVWSRSKLTDALDSLVKKRRGIK